MSTSVAIAARLPRRARLASCLCMALGTSLLGVEARIASAVALHDSAAVPTHAAATIVVDSCDDSGTGSLRAAAAAAIDGDVIDLSTLACSLITLTTGAIDVAVPSLQIIGGADATLTVDANLLDRAFDHSGTGTFAISDLRITRGRITSTEDGATARGGCINSGGTLQLDHVTVSECAAYAVGFAKGGGIAANAVVISDSRIENNSAELAPPRNGGARGGGIYSSSSIDVTRSTLSGNSAIAEQGEAWGGGLVSLGSATTVTDSAFSGNVARGYPYAPTIGSFTLGQAMGGAIAIVAYAPASLSISGSTLSGNSAASGGAIAVTVVYEDGVKISNSTISGNTATSMGGGLWQVYGDLDVSNSTVAFNSAAYGGGGIMPRHDLFQGIYTFPPVLESTIVSSNTSTFFEADVFSRMTKLAAGGSHNLITSTNLPFPDDTIDSDPRLGPLGDHGGPTLTHELQAGSPAIDSGSNPSGLAFDQRGDGFPRVAGAASDIGALEQSPTPDTIFDDGFD